MDPASAHCDTTLEEQAQPRQVHADGLDRLARFAAGMLDRVGIHREAMNEEQRGALVLARQHLPVGVPAAGRGFHVLVHGTVVRREQ